MENSVGLALFHYLPFARRWVVHFCPAIDPKHFDDVLTLAFKDKSPSIRYEAIQRITKNRYWSSIDPVIAAIKDRNEKVRMAAVIALAQFGSPRLLDALFVALQDPNPLVRAEAVRALRKHPKRRYRQEVQELSLDRQANVRLAALESLLVIHCSEDFVSKLLDLAMDSKQSSHIRQLAFENMRQAERLPVSLLGRLEQIARDENAVALHLEIVKVVAAYPPGDEMQIALIQFLHHISDDVHRVVVQALGEKGDRKAIFYLSELVREGRKTNQLMNKYDSRLAEMAIKHISSRYP